MRKCAVSFAMKQNIIKKLNPEPEKGSDYLVDYLVRVLLFLFPLYIYESAGVMGISMKDILFGIVVLIMSLWCIGSLLLKKVQIGKKEIFLFGVFSIVVICFLVQVVMLSAEVPHTYIYVGMFLIPFCVGFIASSKKYYMQIFAASYIIMYLSMFRYIFTGRATFLGSEELLDSTSRLVPALLLSCAVCAFLYVTESSRGKRLFYLALEAVGLFIFFLYGDTVAFMIMLLFLMCLQFVRRATVSFMKRNMILLFVFAFCASNVPILAHFCAIGFNRKFNLEYSISIDLFLAFAGYMIARYWDRIPKDHDEDHIVMVKFARGFRQSVLVVIALIGFCFIFGSRGEDLLGAFGGEVLSGFSVALWNSVCDSYGELWHVLEVYGIVGSMVLLVFIVAILNMLYRAWNDRRTTEEEKGFILITVMFILQSFFYPLSSASTPAYLIFSGFALKAVWKEEYVELEEEEDLKSGFDMAAEIELHLTGISQSVKNSFLGEKSEEANSDKYKKIRHFLPRMGIIFITILSSVLLVMIFFAVYRVFVPAGVAGGESSLVQSAVELREQQTATIDQKENEDER